MATLLGITSLPSVTDVLTWKEFAFVQSKLGWLCLCFGTAHDLFMGFRYIFIEPPILCGFFFTATTVSSKFLFLQLRSLFSMNSFHYFFWSKMLESNLIFCPFFFLVCFLDSWTYRSTKTSFDYTSDWLVFDKNSRWMDP